VGFAAAAVVGFLFVWHEARAPQPMLPLSLFAHRMFALTALVGVLFNIAFYGLIFVLSLYFQNIRGWSPFATGLAFVPMMAMVLPANLVAASVSERLGAPQTIALASVITAVGCVALLPMASDTSYWAIGAQLLVLGGGLGLLVPPLTSTLLGSVDKSRSGIAAGVLNATRQTGSVLGVALFGSLVGGGNEFIAGAHASLVISAAVLLAGAIAISYGRAREPR
jgi:MFS transporter, DHA2 family, methylenomycin A resistance protein